MLTQEIPWKASGQGRPNRESSSIRPRRWPIFKATRQVNLLWQARLCLICLSIDTAIRPSEALALTVDDVNLKEMTVLVRASIAKTRKSRTLPFSIETAKAIQGLITARPREWETPLLFANYEGDRLTISGWRQRLKRFTHPAWPKAFSPYDLRHDAALHFRVTA